jgi:hypothetical protein
MWRALPRGGSRRSGPGPALSRGGVPHGPGSYPDLPRQMLTWSRGYSAQAFAFRVVVEQSCQPGALEAGVKPGRIVGEELGRLASRGTAIRSAARPPVHVVERGRRSGPGSGVGGQQRRGPPACVRQVPRGLGADGTTAHRGSRDEQRCSTTTQPRTAAERRIQPDAPGHRRDRPATMKPLVRGH